MLLGPDWQSVGAYMPQYYISGFFISNVNACYIFLNEVSNMVSLAIWP